MGGTSGDRPPSNFTIGATRCQPLTVSAMPVGGRDIRARCVLVFALPVWFSEGKGHGSSRMTHAALGCAAPPLFLPAHATTRPSSSCLACQRTHAPCTACPSLACPRRRPPPRALLPQATASSRSCRSTPAPFSATPPPPRWRRAGLRRWRRVARPCLCRSCEGCRFGVKKGLKPALLYCRVNFV